MTTQDQTLPAPAPRQRNTLRTVLLVVGSIVLAIILIGTAFRVAYSLNQEETSGTFVVGDEFDTVELRTSAANVKIEYTDIDEPEIAFDQGETNLRLDYNVSGGVLDVRVDHRGWGWWGWGFGGWGWNNDAKVHLSLPQAMETDGVDLVIETTAGDLDVFGDYGDVEIESTAGDLRMSGAAANLQITTTAGDLRLKDVAVDGSFRSESTAGDSMFEFRSLPDSIDARSTAGDVRVTLPDGSYRVDTNTTAGEVRQDVSSDQGSDRVYRFETTAGDIELNER
jgi:DUF4097 and DUF4098 domain-containing protein YvlB